MRDPLRAFRFFLAVQRPSAGSEPEAEFSVASLCFLVRPEDYFALQEVVLDSEYRFLELIPGKVPPETVVDLGANIGLFSGYVLSIWPGATVHSVEPAGSTYRQLEKNRFLNPSFRWHTLRAAVWTRDGDVALSAESTSTSRHVVLSADMASGLGLNEVVPGLRLGTILQECVRGPVDLLKMDIEGAEGLVLEDVGDNLRRVRHLVVEVHAPACSPRRAYSLLSRTYELIHCVPGRRSSKLLLVASHEPWPLPPYGGT